MIAEGQTIEVQGSAKKPYILTCTGGVPSCSCPAWRNQSHPIDRRTCKHLKKILGVEAEVARTSVVDEKNDAIVQAEAALGRKLRTDEKTKMFGPKLMLAHPYTLDVDPTGWWYSEKLDGCRAYWNGTHLVSRGGNIFQAPAWFTGNLPLFPLDGELYLGRKSFERTMSIVRRADAGEAWRDIQYMIFDAPGPGPFEMRIARACGVGGPNAKILGHGRIQSPEHLEQTLGVWVAAGAEGIMLRRPDSLYEEGRSHSLLKVKPFSDAEAKVVGYEPGKGRHKGRLGALTVMLLDGQTFELGTGLTDRERESPPPIGSTVTYRFTELTSKGIPKCAAFLRARPEE